MRAIYSTRELLLDDLWPHFRKYQLHWKSENLSSVVFVLTRLSKKPKHIFVSAKVGCYKLQLELLVKTGTTKIRLDTLLCCRLHFIFLKCRRQTEVHSDNMFRGKLYEPCLQKHWSLLLMGIHKQVYLMTYSSAGSCHGEPRGAAKKNRYSWYGLFPSLSWSIDAYTTWNLDRTKDRINPVARGYSPWYSKLVVRALAPTCLLDWRLKRRHFLRNFVAREKEFWFFPTILFFFIRILYDKRGQFWIQARVTILMGKSKMNEDFWLDKVIMSKNIYPLRFEWHRPRWFSWSHHCQRCYLSEIFQARNNQVVGTYTTIFLFQLEIFGMK